MGLTFDTTQAARTEDELEALVEAVFTAPESTQETHWLEWKSSLEMSSAEGKFAVSKAILGFANRAVDHAQLACEGLAYMLVGVKPGAAPGIATPDHAVLGQGIKTYVPGIARWSPHYIEFRSVTVLVIVVEAPKPGQRIATLQKEYSTSDSDSSKKKTFRAGTIFHRAEAHTEPAGPKEVEMLEERLLQGVREPDLELNLEVLESKPLVRLDVGPDAIARWIKAREAHAREASRPDPSDYEPIPGLHKMMMGRYATSEEKAEFDQRVIDHLAECREQVVNHAVHQLTRSTKNEVAFTVTNPTKRPIKDVQLLVRLMAPDLFVCAGHSRPASVPALPTWPDVLDKMFSRERDYRHLMDASGVYDYPFSRLDAHVEDRGDFTELTYTIGDLRPGQPVETRPVTVVVWSPEQQDTIPVQLIARSMNREGDKTSASSLAVSPQQWDLSRWCKP
jgi:hypothetical protein